MESKRKITQFLTALLYNLNLKGLLSGSLFRGASKGICVPGLNCYSCPAAVGSCPLGALQSTLMTLKSKVNLFVVGLIGIYSVLFGRLICGWLCPFGLLQELLYKIPTPKAKWSLKRLRWVKYAILVIFVLAIPVFVMFQKGIGYPAFCKYICPQGTIGGTLLILGDPELTELAGMRFLMKWSILLVLLIASVFLFRPFCRLLCPLGALYGLFNSIALIHIHLDTDKCSSCGACKAACPMQIDPVTSCNGTECIRCGKCMTSCSDQAIHFGAATHVFGAKTQEEKQEVSD